MKESALVERGASAVAGRDEPLPHRLSPGDERFNLGELPASQAAELVMRRIAAIDGFEQFADLLEREAGLLRDADDREPFQHGIVVDAVRADAIGLR